MASLAGVLPELAAAESKLRALAAARGIVYTVADFGGVRSEADTNRILKYRDDDYAVYVRQMKAAGRAPVDKQTFRPIAPFGGSMHNFGAAFDAEMVKGTLEQLGALAPQAGLKWGGTFTTRKDYPHFELPIGLLEAKRRWLARGNQAGSVSGLGAVAVAVGNLPEHSTAVIIWLVVAVLILLYVLTPRRGRQ